MSIYSLLNLEYETYHIQNKTGLALDISIIMFCITKTILKNIFRILRKKINLLFTHAYNPQKNIIRV